MRLMRQILVQFARSRQAGERDGGLRIARGEIPELPVASDDELVALEELMRIDERQGEIVQMKVFGGLTVPEIAQVPGILRPSNGTGLLRESGCAAI
jgi:DNA-directed RNA polymerase specialized sigma24 family protein